MSEEEKKQDRETDEVSESAAARRLRALGQNEEARPAIEVSHVGFWENFWYHYKWPTILTVIGVAVAVVCILQLLGKESPDVYVMYAGPGYLTSHEAEDVRSAFRQIMEDYNGDGERGVMLTDINYLSPEQIAEKKAKAEAEGVDLIIDNSGNAAAYERFETEIMAGESVVLLLDPALYGFVKKSGALMPLSEILDAVPEYALDDTGIRLADTPFAQYFTAMSVFPEDTVLCVRALTAMSALKGRSRTERLYGYHLDFFGKLTAFKE